MELDKENPAWGRTEKGSQSRAEKLRVKSEVLTVTNGAPDLQRGLNLLSNTWGVALKILLALVKIKWK
ncbi:hypothetical protein TNCV_237271 [Trichonephila clavipes]|nr:hypothetical protein TNCV_237271 [Trichonephila clavipes]